METEVLIVGAGVSGLACARALAEAGKRTVLLEKSRGVGGRCATRRVIDTRIDHGIAFYHGSDEDLLSTLKSAGGDEVVSGWPLRIRGEGTPCQPSAFRPGDWRLALAGGVNTFPKWLARGLDVRLNSRVTTMERAGNLWRVTCESGDEITARDLVLTSPVPQTLDLLGDRPGESRDLKSARALLQGAGFVSTLTVLALYAAGGPVPDWDLWYPEDSTILHLLSHDSAKRAEPERTVLVLQASPAWSRKQWERPEAEWRDAMLDEAGRLAGPWAAEPQTTQTHRWRYARIGSGGDLTGPILVSLPGGRRLAFAGDAFAPGGGIQAAWRSGGALARRLLREPGA